MLLVQHRGLKRHCCADHNYHIKSMYNKSRQPYSLYIDFITAFSSVLCEALFQVLSHQGLTWSTLVRIQRLYACTQNAPLANEQVSYRYVQERSMPWVLHFHLII